MSGLYSRRRFLRNSLVVGCSAAASPLVTPVTLAAVPGEARLVVIILRGAMDGLDAVQPYGDRDFASYRQKLPFGPDAGAQDLDGFFSLNQGLGDLMPMWKGEELGFAHAVSTPYRDKRSHFDGQDVLEAGVSGEISASNGGWLNRALSLIPHARAETALAVGRDNMLLLKGDAPAVSWSPEIDMELSDHGRSLLDMIYADDPLFHSASAQAIELSQEIDRARGMNSSKAQQAGALASFAAQRLNDETRIAAFSIGGWDTHRGQKTGLPKALQQLATSLTTLKAELGANWSKTVVLAMTEFGRTVRENGGGGTDHGTGGAMVMAGGMLRGGRVYTDWPGLGESALYAGRDLMPTRDVRAYAAWMLRVQFGLAVSDLEGLVFPGLDMGNDPSLSG